MLRVTRAQLQDTWSSGHFPGLAAGRASSSLAMHARVHCGTGASATSRPLLLLQRCNPLQDELTVWCCATPGRGRQAVCH